MAKITKVPLGTVSPHPWRMKLGRPYLQMAAFAPELESHQLRAEGVATRIYQHQ